MTSFTTLKCKLVKKLGVDRQFRKLARSYSVQVLAVACGLLFIILTGAMIDFMVRCRLSSILGTTILTAKNSVALPS